MASATVAAGPGVPAGQDIQEHKNAAFHAVRHFRSAWKIRPRRQLSPDFAPRSRDIAKETDIPDRCVEPADKSRRSHDRDFRSVLRPDGRPRPRISQWRISAFATAAVLAAILGMGMTIANVGLLQWGVLALAAAVVLLTTLVWSAVLAPQRRRAARAVGPDDTATFPAAVVPGEVEQLAGLGIWSFDRRTREFSWSTGAFRMFGLSEAAGIPKPDAMAGFVHADDRRRWREACRQALAAGAELRIEYRWLRPDGRQIRVFAQGRAYRDRKGAIAGLSGIVQDITDLHAIRQALQASETRFRDLAHLSSDWIWETDAEHRLVSMSDARGPLADDWSRSMIGHRRWETPAHDLPITDWSVCRHACERHESFENIELSQVDLEGKVHHQSISGRPMYDASGEFIGYRGIGRNITREKRQRLLLELEGDISAILREQTEPALVIEAALRIVCDKFGWIGGIHFECHGRVVRKRVHHGHGSEFADMIAALPDEIPFSAGSIEEQGCRGTSAAWNIDPASCPAFASRYRAQALGVRASFTVGLRNQVGHPAGILLFLSPIATRSEIFFEQVAEVLSRTLSLFLQRKAAEQRLTRASMRDALTGLSNRAHILQQIETHLRRGTPTALLYVDLDRYKLINDTLGHSAGDKALGEIARRLSETAGPGHAVGRMGGDEFIVLVSPADSRDDVEALGRRILQAIERPLVLSNRAFFLSASIGIAFSPEDANDAQALIRCADAAMYQVKSVGRSDVRFFTGGVSDTRAMQLQLLAEMPQAIEHGQVELHYQPIIDISARTVTGYEALLRWHHPTHGLLLPDQFLPVAEQHRSIREIGLWSIQRALEDRIHLGIDTWPGLTVSVNVSALQFNEDDFLATLNGLMLDLDFPPQLLRLELTESAFIENPQRAAVLIGDLRRLGVQVIVDNFGTGYASLSYLKNLPVDGLKIDHTFIQNLPSDRGNAAIVQAITAMAGKLGMQAVAEGVETPGELHELRLLACEQVQGALISCPLPLPELAGFLETMPALRRMHHVRDDDLLHTHAV